MRKLSFYARGLSLVRECEMHSHEDSEHVGRTVLGLFETGRGYLFKKMVSELSSELLRVGKFTSSRNVSHCGHGILFKQILTKLDSSNQ